MKTIPLTRNHFAIVNDADYPSLSIHKWSLTVGPTGKKYAHRRRKKSDGPGSKSLISMHRVIMGVQNQSTNIVVDHMNGDGLDNRRENMRLCKPGENSKNIQSVWGKSGVRGISQTKSGKWRARIRCDLKLIEVGTFDTERDASIAYGFASRVFHGEFGSTPGHEKFTERTA